jgi:hypothetical protein
MKSGRWTSILALLGLLAVGRGAGAAEVGFHAGYSTPTGELENWVGDGFYAGFSIGRLVGHSGGGVTVNGHFLGEKTGTLATGPITTVRQTPRIWEVMIFAQGALAPKSAPVVPYMKLGAGLHVIDEEVTLAGPSWSVTFRGTGLGTGLLGGVGVSWKNTPTTDVGLEFLFHHTVGEGEDEGSTLATIALTLGLRGSRPPDASQREE